MRRTFAVLLMSLTASCSSGPSAQRETVRKPNSLDSHVHRFSAVGDHFELDGKPFQILSGEMHYERTPHENWRLRLRAAKAMGLNTVSTYVFWNAHEKSPGVFDFSGDNDVAEFIREAQEEGLYVLLRAGPYICAEWDFGGLPAWLLRKPDVKVRTMDPRFLSAVAKWFQRLGQELAPLQLSHGGPILAVQVENEYSNFDYDNSHIEQDRIYLDQIRRLLVASGFDQSLMFTANGVAAMPRGSLPNLVAGMNFGPDDARKSFADFGRQRPSAPLLVTEYWTGSYDHWGERHQTDSDLSDFSWMLGQGASINLYMFHGGTSFGWMSGADDQKPGYHPYVTSYDYDAPLDEAGRPTAKFRELRAAIEKHTGVKPTTFPHLPTPMTVPAFSGHESVSLWESLPTPTHSDRLLSMEDLGQNYGLILYRSTLSGPRTADLKLSGLNDYAQIYLDGKLVGTLDRRLAIDHLTVKVKRATAQLDILVMNSGRINIDPVIQQERKGIADVHFGDSDVGSWEIFSLPMSDLSTLKFTNSKCLGPCFYRASFAVNETRDTFLDTKLIGKGMVWLNDRALGRVWNIGPQRTLYTPGVWLRQGANSVTAFDMFGTGHFAMQGLAAPILMRSEKLSAF